MENSNIKNYSTEETHIEKSERLIRERSADAEDFISKIKSLSSDVSTTPDFDQRLIYLQKHKFPLWLNKESNFNSGKKKLIDLKLIPSIIKTIAQNTNSNLLKVFSLEYITACAISFSATNGLKDVLALKEKYRLMDQESYEEMVVRSENFELREEKLLFLNLLKKLKNSEGDIFKCGKTHDYQIREFMMKIMIDSLFKHFPNQLTNSSAINIALDIVAIFFDPMSKKDAYRFTKKIRIDVDNSQKFLKSTVEELIHPKSS